MAPYKHPTLLVEPVARPTQTHPCRLEVCVDSPRSLYAAVEGGAARIELCSALSLGGLTPGPGLVRTAQSLGHSTRAMIRPTEGGFVYGPDDLDVMRRDIDAMADHGLEGVVMGALTPKGYLDESFLARLCSHAKGLKMTLHRAIDLTPDPLEALETAIGLGFDTVLTSGTQMRAIEGLDIVRALVETSAGRIDIMAGGGINAAQIGEIIGATGVNWVHGSCSRLQEVGPAELELGLSSDSYRLTEASLVRAICDALQPQN
ncbi:copper homeostasis protein CutC [Asticcacaulis sp. DXS10W]|uniref:PF03932 family protein CutC n=1 Tax=Asticcacaulis currens TaxID=2984210 RepID=A0ABT5IDL9_9CAUL|nr:copper homeostasis protein CutC [Asticcacaulis currens]MDC7694306.1 copper homeostasis protein CutC [Asticcacaulis currens]